MAPPLSPRALAALGAALAVASVLFAAASRAPVVSDPQFGYAGGLAWERAAAGGLDRALARADGKPVVVYFWAVWCQYCKQFDTEVFRSPGVRPLLEERFHRVFVDLDEDRATANRFNVRYPPTLLFLDPDGSVRFRLAGFVGADEFRRLLLDVLGGAEGSQEGNQTRSEPGLPPSPAPP